MVVVADEIDGEYNYNAWSFTKLGLDPSINSNGAIGSILKHTGLNIEGNEPYSFGIAPSIYHLIGKVRRYPYDRPKRKTVVLSAAGAVDGRQRMSLEQCSRSSL